MKLRQSTAWAGLRLPITGMNVSNDGNEASWSTSIAPVMLDVRLLGCYDAYLDLVDAVSSLLRRPDHPHSVLS